MFSKKPEQSLPAMPQSRKSVANSSTFSVFGTDVTVRGNIEASADLHIDGNVIGDISCASLVQGDGSRIEGEIKAESARLAGTVEGRIDATELVVLKSARIHGDVTYETLTIEQGAQVNGRFAPHGADLVAGKVTEAAPLPGAGQDGDQMMLTN